MVLSSRLRIPVTVLSLLGKHIVRIIVSTDTVSVLSSQRHCLSLSGKDDVKIVHICFHIKYKHENISCCQQEPYSNVGDTDG